MTGGPALLPTRRAHVPTQTRTRLVWHCGVLAYSSCISPFVPVRLRLAYGEEMLRRVLDLPSERALF